VADAIVYVQKGKIKLSVVSHSGKEAVVALLGAGDFFGEGCLAGKLICLSTASAMSDCSITRLEKATIVRVLRDQPAFLELFMKHLLTRNIRIEEDLVDQPFNSSEKRLARVLLLLANFGKDGKPEAVIPKISQGHRGGDCGHHAVPNQIFYESVPQAWLHQLQRRASGSSSLLSVVLHD
jgi:CRP-like cAMP-binding protein